jgi:hypothetical protein
MRVCYIILTCQPYLKTRCEWQRRTWLSKVDMQQHAAFFLSAQADESKNVLGYGTADDYTSCPAKYLAFLRNTDLSEDYDWILFVDDDTYIFHDRLLEYLSALDSTQSIYVGHLLQNEYPPYMSGGAGFAMSRPFYKDVMEYVRTEPDPPRTDYSDQTLGHWITAMERRPIFVHCDRLNGVTHDRCGKSPDTELSFHYVTEAHFEEYAKYT